MLLSIKAEITSVSRDSFIIEQWHDMTDPGCAMSLPIPDKAIRLMAKRLLHKTAFIKANFDPFTKEFEVFMIEE